MSKLNTLSGGYKGSSTKIRSSNSRPIIIEDKIAYFDKLKETCYTTRSGLQFAIIKKGSVVAIYPNKSRI